MSGFVSPNEMFAEAKKAMLENREPETHEDWQLVMNFFAANIDPESAEPACLLLSAIYAMPLTKEEVREIVAFQVHGKLPTPMEI